MQANIRLDFIHRRTGKTFTLKVIHNPIFHTHGTKLCVTNFTVRPVEIDIKSIARVEYRFPSITNYRGI